MELQNCINYLLTGAQHEVFQLMSERLMPYEVTPGQYGVLACLWEKDESNPKEIAQALGLENSTMSGILDRMQKKGLIDRGVDPEDRRCVHVRLSPRGRELKEPVLQVVAQVNEEIWSQFSPQDADTLRRCLKTIQQKYGS
ncbi:MAG TPA: MarR family transcriptional regulator [Firmicutes bacterium]|nr:MarR family transcriptional regulator [Candidatus Enterenecus merdae]HJH62499.1 MarR family transcriptional regulator [Bacillota bacterium]